MNQIHKLFSKSLKHQPFQDLLNFIFSTRLMDIICACMIGGAAYPQCVADWQSSQSRVDPTQYVRVVALKGGKNGGKQNDEVTNELQPNGQPPAE